MSADTLEAPTVTAAHGQGRMVDTIGAPVVVSVEDLFGVMVPLDPCLIVGEVTIRYGREAVSTPVAEPATASLHLIAPPGEDAAIDYPLRRRLRIDLSPSALAYWGISPTGLDVTRFHGRISEVTAAADAQLGTVLTVTAGGPVADLGRILIGADPWPAESGRARLLRILALAGYGTTGWDGLPPPPGSTQVLARDVDRQTALDLVSTYADESLSYVVDERLARDQVAVYDNLATAARVKAALELPDPHTAAVAVVDSCELLADWSAAWTMAGMLNRLSIGYGPIPDGGEQPRAVFEDATSQGRFGVMEASMSTDLATAADAASLAAARFAALAEPTPSLPELRCDLWLTLPVAQGKAVLRLHPNDLVGLIGIPPSVPVNRPGLVVLNGYTETITPESWGFTLAVFDPLPGGNTQLWYLIPPGDTWANTPPAVLWATAGSYDW